MKRFISLFLGDVHDFRNQKTREKMGLFGSVTGLAVNIFLACMKIILGILSASVAIMADGFNNLSDAGGSLVSLVTVKLAQKPYDKDHPFGHGRVEYIGALGVGILIFIFAYQLIRSSVESLLDPVLPDFSVIAIVMLGVSIALKLFLWRLYAYIGKNTDNPTMNAASQDSLNDVMATAAVLLTAILTKVFASSFEPIRYLDGLMGLVVAVLVLKAGYSVLKDTINRLIGASPDRELGNNIIKKILSYPEILGVHDFVLHDYGPGRCMASVHAEVSAESNIVQIHEVIDLVERQITEELNIPICIHMDPIEQGNSESAALVEKLKEFLGRMDPPLRLHDFRRVPGENQINLIFDVVLQDGRLSESELRQKIGEYAMTLDARHRCVIHFDRDYFADNS